MTFKNFIKFTKGKAILTIIQGALFFLFKSTAIIKTGGTLTFFEKIPGTIANILNPFFNWLVQRSGTALSMELDQVLWFIITPIYWYLIACIIITIYNALKK